MHEEAKPYDSKDAMMKDLASLCGTFSDEKVLISRVNRIITRSAATIISRLGDQGLELVESSQAIVPTTCAILTQLGILPPPDVIGRDKATNVTGIMGMVCLSSIAIMTFMDGEPKVSYHEVLGLDVDTPTSIEDWKDSIE